MSIASEITRLQNAKAAIKAAIEAKGVEVDDDATLDAFASLIGQIATSDDTILKTLIDRSITSIEIPSGVTTIGVYSFYGCSFLANVILPNSLTSIEQGGFQGCKALQSITLPNYLIILKTSAFAGCDVLESVNLSNVVEIGLSCFNGCKALVSIELPATVTTIKTQAFKGCTLLSSVTIRATTPPTLATAVFDSNVSGRKIYVPATSVNAYKTATNWSAYANDIEAIPTNS